MQRTLPAGARVLGPVLAGAATAWLLWWRLGPVTRGTVWAEDGGLFLRERVALGPVASLLHPYAGYRHLLARLLVDLGYALPTEHYASVLAAGSCIVVGLLAAAVFVLARDVVPSPSLRLLLALLPALLPLAPYEIAGNAANLHWFALWAAPWVLAHRSRSWWASAAVAVLAGLIVLTELQTVLFLPLLVLALAPDRPAARPSRHGLPVAVVAVLCAAAQLVAATTDERTRPAGTPAFGDVAAGFLLQPLAALWGGVDGPAAAVRAVVDDGWVPVLLPAAAVAAVLVGAVLVGPWRVRWIVVALAAASFGVWWASLVANGTAQHWATPAPALAAVPPVRYAAAAGLLLVTALVVAASALVQQGGRLRVVRAPAGRRPGGAARLVGTAAGWAVVALVVVVTVAGVAPGPTRRGDGPEWAAQIPAARAACAGEPAGAAPTDGEGTVPVRTVPWGADVPCSWLLR